MVKALQRLSDRVLRGASFVLMVPQRGQRRLVTQAPPKARRLEGTGMGDGGATLLER
ncbi:hypothetical protein NITMOv2_0269 [Nitrospira moscoviensis]|uniref:Uncharacterized protein n=1 Tax=Nitrospira moscoviensis TaxID=42253 RepID=A0A0K2G6X9_NITMO|nr:hypothetical protein NITMOv2_0269 [Nitrospira moscoviensis]